MTPSPFPLDRYDMYCTRYGCFQNYFKDDMENPFPSLWQTGGVWYPDPRIPVEALPSTCGPLGCAPLPVFLPVCRD